MAFPRDQIPYSAIIDRPPLRLPRSARVVMSTIVNVEVWDIQAPMPRTVLPPPGGAQAIPDVANFGWFEYGMRVGFWRLKSVFDKHKIKVTMGINGAVCSTYPRIAEASREAGWEFLGHGFIQQSLSQAENQREIIRKSVEEIRKFTGKTPSGWEGPGLVETPKPSISGGGRISVCRGLGQRRATLRDQDRPWTARLAAVQRRAE